MIETEAELSGRRLNPGDALEFRCHPGVACFNSCCRDKRLSLLPYDVVRLARALGRPTGEFLAQHAVLEIEPGSGWPTLRLELAPDGRCPFVGEGGCGVYRDRPTCCRIFPLARAVRLDGCGAAVESFAVDASCPGFGERGPARSPTVAEWTSEQGLDPYRAANDRVARLLLHPRRRRPLSLATDDVHAVVMALYNVDVFRVFAARPGFGERCGLDDEAVARALSSDEALLALGQDWIARRLFG